MTGSEVAWSAATEEASWITPRLAAFGADRVDSVVPGGFAAYARLPHPVWRYVPGESPNMVRWGEVAAWSEIALEPTTQFHDIALPQQAPAEAAPWNSEGPQSGALPADDAAVLVDLLAEHTPNPQRCWFCVWDGYGWGQAPAMTVTATEDPAPPPSKEPTLQLRRDHDPVPRSVRSGPRVQLPKREYLLYSGPISAALVLVEERRQTPNLWWPQDHAWCLASEIDLPWTYLGGSAPLIETVLADPRLEAMPARPEDPIQLRVHGWLNTLIAKATLELLKHETVTVTTGRGSVHATLKPPVSSSPDSRWSLFISRETPNRYGSGGEFLRSSSNTAMRDLHDELRLALDVAVTNLVNM